MSSSTDPAVHDSPVPGVDEHVVRRELAELEARGERMQLMLTPAEALMLLGEIQLACRHPNNKGYPRRYAEELGRELQRHLSVQPGLAKVCAAGWQGAR